MPTPTSHDAETLKGHGRLGWRDAPWAALQKIADVAALACVLRADQRRRWKQGQPAVVEHYFEDFPAVREDRRLAADFVFQEYCLRDEHGPPPQLDEFRQRFPQLVAELEARCDPQRVLAEGMPQPAVSTGLSMPDDEFPSVKGYDILRELGRGGMGVVYLAHQEGLDRFVALKMILPGPDIQADDLMRFRVEAAAISRMQHLNLVQIYGIGEHEGAPFFSLEFVDGGSLEDKLNGKPMPPREAAGLAATLARAIHAAHERGIVHRDLKPGNVLLTSDGTPKITDFGIAKRVDRGGKAQREDILGTPCYMAPEQILGKTEEIGPRTDIYALGSMLYEFLTGWPPFNAETVNDTLLQVINQPPEPPSRLQPAVPPELERICLKCLEKNPATRYPTALALAEDLERFLAHGEAGSGLFGWLRRWWSGDS
jgi:serine/threonine-protein kinase